MPELTAREDAEDFLSAYSVKHDDSSTTFYLWVEKLTELMEKREGAAESTGREEMVDSAMENVALNLQVKHLLPVLEAARSSYDVTAHPGHDGELYAALAAYDAYAGKAGLVRIEPLYEFESDGTVLGYMSRGHHYESDFLAELHAFGLEGHSGRVEQTWHKRLPDGSVQTHCCSVRGAYPVTIIDVEYVTGESDLVIG